MKKLYVLYDMDCGFCCACMRWMLHQAPYVPLQFIGRQTETARRHFHHLLRPDEPDEMVVVSDAGAVYRGTSAYLICLWALKGYRAWSLRLSRGPLRGLARNLFHAVARRRLQISQWLGLRSDAQLADHLRPHQPLACAAPAPAGVRAGEAES